MFEKPRHDVKKRETCFFTVAHASPAASSYDPDIGYIWDFISFYISLGERVMKKSFLPLSNVEDFFYDVIMDFRLFCIVRRRFQVLEKFPQHLGGAKFVFSYLRELY